MHRRKNPTKFLYLFIIFIFLLLGLIYFYPPEYKFQIFGYRLSVISLFFPLLFFITYSLTAYLSKSSKHGVLAGLFIVFFLIFRLTNLTHPFFFLLLASLFLILELLFSYRK
jgi:hypothetical protein